MDNTTKPAMKPGVRGWLLFFAITLVAVGPLVRTVGLIASYAPVAAIAERFPKFVAVYAATCVVELALIAWSIWAGVSILQARRGAVRVARLFLILNPIMLFVCTIAYALANLPPQVMDVMSKTGAEITSRALVYSIIWGLYLKFSKRVRETFGGHSPARLPVSERAAA